MGWIIHYILWKIKNVWNHQPDKYNGYVVAYITNTSNADFSEFTWKVRTITLPLRCKGIPGSRPVSDIIIAKWKRYMSFHMNIQVYVCIYIYTQYIYIHVYIWWLSDDVVQKWSKMQKKKLSTHLHGYHPIIPQNFEKPGNFPFPSPPHRPTSSDRFARRGPRADRPRPRPQKTHGFTGGWMEILMKSSPNPPNLHEIWMRWMFSWIITPKKKWGKNQRGGLTQRKRRGRTWSNMINRM